MLISKTEEKLAKVATKPSSFGGDGSCRCINTIEDEDKLRLLLQIKYDSEDLNAFFMLQLAAMEGRVKQQSRELLHN